MTESGRLFTFGSNEFGQLGLGHNTNVLKPSCVKSLKPDKVVRVACGKAHTVVAMESGKMFGFGSNTEGQLGIGRHPESVNKPVLERRPRKIACLAMPIAQDWAFGKFRLSNWPLQDALPPTIRSILGHRTT